MDGSSGPSDPQSSAAPGRPTWLWMLLGCGALALVGLAVVAVAVALLIPNVHRPSDGAGRAACKNHLRQIGIACHLYADDCDGVFPAGLEMLVPTYVDNPKIFACQSARRRRGAIPPAPGMPVIDYEYFAGRDAALPGEFLLAVDKDLENHGGDGFNVLFVDAHHEWWPAARVAELRRLVADEDRAVEAIRAEPKRRAELLDAWRQARSGAAAPPPAAPGGG